MNTFFSISRMWRIFQEYYMFYIQGALLTVGLSILAVMLGSLLGAVFASGKMSRFKIINWLCSGYITIVRSTPLLVQVMVIYYGALNIGIKVFDSTQANAFFWGMLAVALNSGAYMSEIIRSGIGAVEGGQLEAARAIGMKQSQAMCYVILPQAIRNILPALGNEFVTIIKETSIMSMVGIADIMFKAKDVGSLTYQYFDSYLIAAVFYFILVYPLSKLMAYFERRLNRSVTR